MANWSDPRPGASPYAAPAGTRADAIDAGLRSYMLSIYNYMASGVLLTGIVALLFSQTSLSGLLFAFDPLTGKIAGILPLGWIVTIAPIGVVFAMSFGQNRFSTAALQAMFWIYAVLMGMSLSILAFAYTGTSIAGAFFATAAAFAGLSLFGYTTKRNLGPLGAFMVMGLFGMIAGMLINFFLQSSVIALGLNLIGVLVFAGLTAFHTQQAKAMYDYVRGTDMMGKAVIMSALRLYLDFINMFLILLQLFGGRRD
ncbi:Bax inhibitor-1/YccA family protein [Sphingomonas sp. LB-2]|uniref:Bax inhibitor-1/YccA family protein n=1 Tax=Sphingomonas caeni TaxID=2984949 RepID=UPI00222FFAE0|nr:Bax inhibitor-1/YccA family protein [Sphingomonas caeni]MCW3848555.1 Bax inhibitor-1/YccA family protein [Sphingomonas caeni]